MTGGGNRPLSFSTMLRAYEKRFTALERRQSQAPIVDSDWATSGLSIVPASGWSIFSYALRNIGGIARGHVIATYLGATLTADSTANFVDTDVLMLPDGWKTTSPDSEYGFCQYTGHAGYTFRTEGVNGRPGELVITAGTFPGQTLVSGWNVYFPIDHILT